MITSKFKNALLSSKCHPHILSNIKLNARQATSTETETLEPVKLSYASYESTVSEGMNHASPLIIMHGLFGSKSNWNSLCKAYNQKCNPPRRIIAVDARNHGDSPHSDNHSYAHLVADIKALFEKISIPNASLMGHSMGGRAVMLFALKYPELVDRLVIADISPATTSANLNSMPNLFRTLETVILPSEVSMSQARALVDSQLEKNISAKELRSFLLTNLVQRDNGSYDWRINISSLINNFKNIAKFPLVNELQFDGPTLFLAGSNSDYVHKPHFVPDQDTLVLSYASYECTKSYSEKSPEPTPLIVLHGLMASKNHWNSFCKKCHEKTKSKIVAIDARNHGDSPHHRENSYDNLVVDVRQFMEKMDLKKVNLLGHSMGGRTAMLFALKYPELVEKLIVADVSPISTSPEFKMLPKLLNFVRKIDVPESASLPEARKMISQKLFAVLQNKQMVQFMLSNLVQKTEGSYSWRFNAKSLIENFEYIATFPDIHNVSYSGPVLFIGGSKSDYIQKSDYPKILRLFPNAELKYIEGAGHWLHSEKPAEFLKITLDFLNRPAPSSS